MHRFIQIVLLSTPIKFIVHEYIENSNIFYQWTDNLLKSNIQKWKVKQLQID